MIILLFLKIDIEFYNMHSVFIDEFHTRFNSLDFDYSFEFYTNIDMHFKKLKKWQIILFRCFLVFKNKVFLIHLRHHTLRHFWMKKEMNASWMKVLRFDCMNIHIPLYCIFHFWKTYYSNSIEFIKPNEFFWWIIQLYLILRYFIAYSFKVI